MNANLTLVVTLLCLAASCFSVSAQSSDEPDLGAVSSAPEIEPAIHGRSTGRPQEDVGPPPDFAPPPSRDVLGLSPRECRSFPSDLARHRSFQQEKLLWNLRKIASLGGGYGIAVCAEAREAFDRAADQAGDTAEQALEDSSKEAFAKASACRGALAALFARECGSYPGDADCAAAERDVKFTRYLDDQNARFKDELAAREEEGFDLSICGKGRSRPPEGGGQGTDAEARPARRQRRGTDDWSDQKTTASGKGSFNAPRVGRRGAAEDRTGPGTSGRRMAGESNDPASRRSSSGRARDRVQEKTGSQPLEEPRRRLSDSQRDDGRARDESRQPGAALLARAPGGASASASDLTARRGAKMTEPLVEPIAKASAASLTRAAVQGAPQPPRAAAPPPPSAPGAFPGPNVLLQFQSGLLPLKQCREVRAAIQAREKQATRDIDAKEKRLKSEAQKFAKAAEQDPKLKAIDKKIDRFNSDREKILLPKVNRYKTECEGKTLTTQAAVDKCNALFTEVTTLNRQYGERKAKLEAERDAEVAAFQKRWAPTTTRLKEGKEELDKAKEARDKDKELLKTAPPCANKKLTNLEIQQTTPGPIVAGGGGVTLTAVPTPDEADTKYTWSVHPASLGSLSSRSGKTTKFTPGKKPGTGSLLVRDAISEKQALVSLAIVSGPKSCTCFKRSSAPNSIGQQPSEAACKQACRMLGYPGYRFGGGPVKYE